MMGLWNLELKISSEMVMISSKWTICPLSIKCYRPMSFSMRALFTSKHCKFERDVSYRKPVWYPPSIWCTSIPITFFFLSSRVSSYLGIISSRQQHGWFGQAGVRLATRVKERKISSAPPDETWTLRSYLNGERCPWGLRAIGCRGTCHHARDKIQWQLKGEVKWKEAKTCPPGQVFGVLWEMDPPLIEMHCESLFLLTFYQDGVEVGTVLSG